mmetsp:Transcript_10775/g.23873  ORF Transcript_10775/g.23873 Transcript_10775/m.23873 type:complete len:257 (+) Transcript_10775:105-875(+)|eukprot:CAMPEP_0172310814 /NCGR_PEP_ID=MMETSP1058-20130122/12705_1 /TAXON_ID=83371 /ORGANISM="Detonula confervacea, Strain CCMP 353" /LENGTH=256 /DNA_ID=CAMNT_0013023759 /DNA_START=36 /DNA_END=806 /DNA_ORIENTATION=-
MCKPSIAIILYAATIITGATSNDVLGTNIRLRSSVGQRSLSQSLLHSWKPKPEVDRCWGEIETDEETGEKRPAIKCEFIVTKHYNSTSYIKLGTCQEFNEPACEEKVDGACVGPFALSGKIRTTIYPEIHPDMYSAAETNHTYCARADVYQDIDSSGRQSSIAHVAQNLIITFTGSGNDEEYLVNMEETDTSEKGNPTAAIIVSLIGILIVIPIAALFCMKRHKGGMKIHEDLSNTEGDADDAKDVDIEKEREILK